MSSKKHEAIATSGAPAAVGPYSQAVRAGDLVFCSGQIPLDPLSGTIVSGGFRGEAERVLVPDGHLVLSCFNPMSLWGAWHSFGGRDAYPWRGRFIHLLRLKDWLSLLGFELAGGAMGCYAPPCTSQKWLDRWRFMDAAGDRWWPFSGAVSFLHAVKRVHGMRLIVPKWNERLAGKKSLAPAAQKILEKNDATNG